MLLKPNRFPSERTKILWALGFFEGDKAQLWAQSYETKLFKHEKYADWNFFKAKLSRTCDLADEDVDALTKMEEWQYKGDIMSYLDRLKFLNERAQLSGSALKRAVRKGLPEKIIDHMSLLGNQSTTESLWQSLKKAGKAYESALQAKKSVGLGGNTTAGSSSGQSSVTKKNKSQGETSTNPTSPKGKGRDTQNSKSSERSSSKREYPKRFDTFEEAVKGIPKELIKKRSDAKQCARCGKPGHKATFCAGEVNTGSAPKDPKVASTSTQNPEPSPRVEPTVSAITHQPSGFIREIDEDEL